MNHEKKRIVAKTIDVKIRPENFEKYTTFAYLISFFFAEECTINELELIHHLLLIPSTVIKSI